MSGNSQNSVGNFWSNIKSILQNNRTVYIASILGGITVSGVGLFVDTVQFISLLSPDLDPNKTKSGWILTKIVGWAETSYNKAEQVGGIANFFPFFSGRINGTSSLTPMIYTDLPTDNVNTGTSSQKDVSVLINIDFKGKVKGFAHPINKRNSQTLQAKLIQASVKKKPVCLFVHGTRDNEKSLFYNILRVDTIEKTHEEKYNQIHEDDNERKTQLDQLTIDACGTPSFWK